MKNINVFILGALLVLLLIPLMGVPVYAEEPTSDLKQGDKIILSSGDEAIYLGRSGSGDYRFRAIIGVPQYIPGTTTEIKPNWYYNHNITQWESDTNTFEAIVKNSKVTIWVEGQKMSWEPTVLVGTKDYKPLVKEPTLLSQDPTNPNYWGNTLEWDYGVCKRHLRIIEGVLLEYFIFETNPGADVQIKSNLYKDPNFIWDRPPFAHDANGERIEISLDKTVLLEDLNKKAFSYPITIDPTTTYTVSSSDGYAYGDVLRATAQEAWDVAHDAASGEAVSVSSSILRVKASLCYDPPGETGYECEMARAFVYFDTSGLPDDCDIDSVVLKLYNDYLEEEHGAWTLQIQSGMPTYPHDPLVVGDYLYSHYSGNGGTIGSGSISSGYNSITLSATGESWISLTGSTKFCLREQEHDIDDSKPVSPPECTWSGNRWLFYAYEKGNGYWPKLEVTYTSTTAPSVTTQAASDISTTTAKLHGYLDNDGGGECQVKFQYDTDSGAPYAYDTGWLTTNYTTGQSFNEVVEGLNVDDTYYFRTVAQNDAGVTNGTELEFATLASLNPPTNFQAIPRSSTEISLSWTKGVGSSQTLVRFKEGGYPTTTSDGTEVCNTTRGSDTVTGLTPGTTYGIKAWGYDAGGFSTANVTEMATTFSGEAAGTSPFESPTEPPNFWGPPSYTNLSNLPFYDNFNSIADRIGMERGNFWMLLIWVIAIVLGASFFLTTKQPVFAIIGVSLGIGYGYFAGPIPGWMLLVFTIAAASALYALARGSSNA